MSRARKFGTGPLEKSLGNAPLYDPLGATSDRSLDITKALPMDLQLKGYQYMQFTPPNKDPWILYDRDGKVLGRWEREPSFGELWSFVSSGVAG